jgi:hypothetical protein
MDFQNLLELARGQGLVFWAATGAIALGATLLVVALTQYLRRSLGRGVRRVVVAPPVSSAPPAPPVAVEVARAAAAYEPSTRAPLAALSPTDEAEEPSLALLLRRLQTAGDRLEEIAGEVQAHRRQGSESTLKEDLQAVEYVFKACGP